MIEMKRQAKTQGTLSAVWRYVVNLRDSSPYWRLQATAWGIVLVVLVATGLLFAVLAFSSISGGGNISYAGVGSPGPVSFRHQTHMWFQSGKYKDCKTCHDAIFATEKYGTFVLRALKNSPEKKVRIGRDASTLYVPDSPAQSDLDLITYEVPRACATCATGNCHDGKESFSRLECLRCHRTQ